jgi:hypothetical protein
MIHNVLAHVPLVRRCWPIARDCRGAFSRCMRALPSAGLVSLLSARCSVGVVWGSPIRRDLVWFESSCPSPLGIACAKSGPRRKLSAICSGKANVQHFEESKSVTCPVRIDASQKLAPIQARRPASTSHEYVIDRERATHLCVNHANRRPEFNCCGRDSSPRPVEDVTRSLENVAARKTCTECRDHNGVARPGARGPATVGIVRNRAYRCFAGDWDSCYRYPLPGVCSLLCALRFGLREGRRSDERADKRDQYLFHIRLSF